MRNLKTALKSGSLSLILKIWIFSKRIEKSIVSCFPLLKALFWHEQAKHKFPVFPQWFMWKGLNNLTYWQHIKRSASVILVCDVLCSCAIVYCPGRTLCMHHYLCFCSNSIYFKFWMKLKKFQRELSAF